MPTRRSLSSLIMWLVLAASFANPAYAERMVYVSLPKPCRLLDTRTSDGGPGPLTAAHGAYRFGARDADINSGAQNGSATGCGIPDGTAAVSVNMNLFDTTGSGNIVTWSVDAGTTAPNIGTAVYNPTVSSAAPGQVQYNTGYTTIPVAYPPTSNPGRFYLQVANGQVDMTINLVGYWLPIAWEEGPSGIRAVALGNHPYATGDYSTAFGFWSEAIGFTSTATGASTSARGAYSTAMGGATLASGEASTAMGVGTTASGDASTAMGSKASTGVHAGSFIYGDIAHAGTVTNTADNQFMVVANGGMLFKSESGDFTLDLPKFSFNTSGGTISSSRDGSTGVQLTAGSGSWTTLSDRHAKTAVMPVDAREVLKKVAALPLNTWQYKAQESKYRHMGPMAQDFYAAFQLGESDKGIDTVDADGVALAAIQGLHALLAEKDGQIAALRDEKDREVAALRTELAAQHTRMTTLESLTGGLAEMRAQLAALRHTVHPPVSVALQP